MSDIKDAGTDKCPECGGPCEMIGRPGSIDRRARSTAQQTIERSEKHIEELKDELKGLEILSECSNRSLVATKESQKQRIKEQNEEIANIEEQWGNTAADFHDACLELDRMRPVIAAADEWKQARQRGDALKEFKIEVKLRDALATYHKGER